MSHDFFSRSKISIPSGIKKEKEALGPPKLPSEVSVAAFMVF
jgi:hypothetical protein